MEMIEKNREAKSVFFMVEFDLYDSYTGGIYEIKLDQLQQLERGKSVGGLDTDPSTLPILEPVLKFFDESWKMGGICLIDGARFGSFSRLYIMVNQIPWPYLKPVTPKHAFFFDTLSSDLELHKVSPPKTSKQYCLVISAYGMLYYLAEPMCFPKIQEPSFERYDPSSDSWESLPPFPDYSLHQAHTVMTGYAVCYGYILLSMKNKKGYEAAAFHIRSRTWHKVKISPKNPYYYPFYGRAVVVDNTIYALARSLNLVLVFSFWWDSDEDGDIAKRRHFLGTPLSLILMDMYHPPCLLIGLRTQNLVHLGRRYFCVVQTGQNNDSFEYRYLCATTFKIAGEGREMKIETVQSSVFRIAIEGNNELKVRFSFTPDYKDIEPEEEEYSATNALPENENAAWTSKVEEDFFSFPTGPKLFSTGLTLELLELLEAFRTKKE
ncbi:putative galactose oxidase, beta-propeller [Rosa chinensis]|uniref:Putative galactose oxidase, beta-propeller n=1 Tax=Rosa chinensis TaxID=74649 RepID=A0A2P6SNH5_ROSCH|nr:putative galactose oxidase, beta-propeller [Rosa chinensis]